MWICICRFKCAQRRTNFPHYLGQPFELALGLCEGKLRNMDTRGRSGKDSGSIGTTKTLSCFRGLLLTRPIVKERQVDNTHALVITGMSVSDIERQKRSKVGRRGAEGRQNAMDDAIPDVPGMIKEIGKEVGKQKAKRRVASRGNGPRQH